MCHRVGYLIFCGCFGGGISVGHCSRAALAVRRGSEFPKASAQCGSAAGPAGGGIIHFGEIPPRPRGGIMLENNSLAYTNGNGARRASRDDCVFSRFSESRPVSRAWVFHSGPDDILGGHRPACAPASAGANQKFCFAMQKVFLWGPVMWSYLFVSSTSWLLPLTASR